MKIRMSRRLWNAGIASALCIIFVQVATADYKVTENFENTSAAPRRFDSAAGSPTRMDTTGFRWTGYTPDASALNVRPDDDIDDRVKTSVNGGYGYTIFDSTGGNTADSVVDNLRSIMIDWNEVWAVNPIGDAEVRVMIRDNNGDWFLSESSIQPVKDTKTYLNAATSTWVSVTSVGTLDDVTNNDTAALTIGAVGTPDLSKVDAGGFYFHSFTNTAVSIVRLDAMEFIGVPPVSGTATEVVTLTDNMWAPSYTNMGSVTVSIPGGTATCSKDTGFRWTGYRTDGGLFNLAVSSYGTLLDSRGHNTYNGHYAYTIFDSTGGNLADSLVRRLRSVTVDMNRIDATDGKARIMIRDFNGDWFLSDSLIDLTGNTIQTLNALTTTWSTITSSTTLNDVGDEDTGALQIGVSGSGSPNLKYISAGGIYWESFSNTDVKVVWINGLTFTGTPVEGTGILVN